MRKVNTVKYNGVDTISELVDLSTMITKALPDVVFKPKRMNKWYIDEQIYPNGVCESFEIMHNTDVNNMIGELDITDYYFNEGSTPKPKYGISSENITDGRNTYRTVGQHKYSIHAKNIVRIAKKALKPLTFKQIAMRNYTSFDNEIARIASDARWKIRMGTNDSCSFIKTDMEILHSMGYVPKDAKFKQVMDYIIANKEFIEKYDDYSPPHYFVLVRPENVQYALRSENFEPKTVQTKDDLPDDVKGKLFVLDITDSKNFVEDVGLKENDGAYWIIA